MDMVHLQEIIFWTEYYQTTVKSKVWIIKRPGFEKPGRILRSNDRSLLKPSSFAVTAPQDLVFSFRSQGAEVMWAIQITLFENCKHMTVSRRQRQASLNPLLLQVFYHILEHHQSKSSRICQIWNGTVAYGSKLVKSLHIP
jgi:hypothetical protein